MAKVKITNGQRSTSVLRLYADHAVTHFAASFEPQIAYAKKLPGLAEAVLKRSKAPHWSATSEKYLIRETNKKFFYHFDHQVFLCQTLGLDPWLANFDDHIDVMSLAFNKMEVTRIKRLGFQITIHLPLEMSHPEMCDLLFGSYLVDRAGLSAIYGRMEDLLLQLHGSYKGIKSQTTIAPQTVEQSRRTFLSTGNLEAFVEPKFLDTCIKEHYERISKECLSLVIDMSKGDTAVSVFRSTLKDSLEGAQEIADGTVLRIKGLKQRGPVNHGDAATGNAS